LKSERPKKAKAKVAQPSFGRTYARVSFSLLNSHMGGLYKRFGGMEDTVRRAGIKLTYKSYLCRMMFTTIIVTVAGLGFSGLVAALLPLPLVSKIAIPLAIGLGGGALSFFIQFLQPRMKMGGRKRRMDEDLAFVVGRMAVLSASGMTPEAIMREVASDDSKDPLTGEFRKMVRDMNLLGMDITGALGEERKRSPSALFNTFLDGMMSTAASGADIQSYLIKQSKDLMSDKRLKSRSISESLGVVAEMYTTVLVVMPLILIILFAVMGVIAGSLGGVSITVLIELVVYVMIPLGGIMIMVLADGIVPKR
jgi:flagellar protein FlaJ